jgi:hypothetical protein
MSQSYATVATFFENPDADGYITTTDAQILATVADAFIDLYAGYVPEVS